MLTSICYSKKANIDYSGKEQTALQGGTRSCSQLNLLLKSCRLAMEKYKTKALPIRLEQLYLKDLYPMHKPLIRMRSGNDEKHPIKSYFKAKQETAAYAFQNIPTGVNKNAAFSSEVNQVSTISPSELVKMGRDLKLIGVGKVLSEAVIKRIFAHVQQDDDGEDGDEDDSEMVYEEFQEVIVVFCCFTDADPYFPIDKRCERFLKGLFAEAEKCGHRI